MGEKIVLKANGEITFKFGTEEIGLSSEVPSQEEAVEMLKEVMLETLTDMFDEVSLEKVDVNFEVTKA